MIYCIEDDANIRDLVVYALNAGGFQAVGFDNSLPFWTSGPDRAQYGLHAGASGPDRAQCELHAGGAL